MNPWGIIFIGIGLIMVIVGIKGSQHSVKDAFASLSPNYSPAASTAATQVPAASGSGSVQTV